MIRLNPACQENQKHELLKNQELRCCSLSFDLLCFFKDVVHFPLVIFLIHKTCFLRYIRWFISGKWCNKMDGKLHEGDSFVYQLWAVTDCICLSGPPDLQRLIGNGPWGEIRGVRSETIVDVLHFSLERLLSDNELHLQRIIILWVCA